MKNIVTQIELAIKEIPFGNSQYQIKTFLIDAQLTPARAYRQICLELLTKLTAIREAETNRKLEDIDIEEMQEKIASESMDKYERRRLIVKLEQLLSARTYTDKIAQDAIIELNTLHAEFVKYPQYTREQFEAEEKEHYLQRAMLAVEFNGSAEKKDLFTITHGGEALRLRLQSAGQTVDKLQTEQGT